MQLGMVIHNHNPSTQEAEVGEHGLKVSLGYNSKELRKEENTW